MGRQRLPAHLRRLPAARRPARRPVRPPAAVPVGIALFTVASSLRARGPRGCSSPRAACRASAARSPCRLALADDEPVHRAGRARQGDGRLRFVAAGGGSIGVLLGGVLTDLLSWHWIFLVNVPIVDRGLTCYSLRLLLSESGGRLDASVDVSPERSPSSTVTAPATSSRCVETAPLGAGRSRSENR